MLESVLNNPNITEESIKTMAQHERCAQPSPGWQKWRLLAHTLHWRRVSLCGCSGWDASYLQMRIAELAQASQMSHLWLVPSDSWLDATHDIHLAQQLHKRHMVPRICAGRRSKTE